MSVPANVIRGTVRLGNVHSGKCPSGIYLRGTVHREMYVGELSMNHFITPLNNDSIILQ